jgi:hypothetical protein
MMLILLTLLMLMMLMFIITFHLFRRKLLFLLLFLLFLLLQTRRFQLGGGGVGLGLAVRPGVGRRGERVGERCQCEHGRVVALRLVRPRLVQVHALRRRVAAAHR